MYLQNMKKLSLFLLLSMSTIGYAQEKSAARQFWENLKNHCGKSYEGSISAGAGNDDFNNKKLTMHVRSCEENTIRIPFFVGENKSRTWVLTFANDRISLKHDHRQEDGSEEKVTQYGGTSTNAGLPEIQFFPADQQTGSLLPNASTNVWWITLDKDVFSYNLRRIGSDRLFTVKFDLSKTIDTPSAPWGWKD
jgi:hypothetical protein